MRYAGKLGVNSGYRFAHPGLRLLKRRSDGLRLRLIRSYGPCTVTRGSNVKWHTDVQSECAKRMLAPGRLGQERITRSRKRFVAP